MSSNLLNLQNAIVDWATTLLPTATVAAHDGGFDLATIPTHHKLPAVLVAYDETIQTEMQGHELVGLPTFTIFVLGQSVPTAQRQAVVVDIAEYIAQNLPRHGNAFGITGASRLGDIALHNLFVVKRDQLRGIALWAVTFTMAVPLLGLAALVNSLDTVTIEHETPLGATASDVITFT